jgi:hypothetical protein
MLLPVGSPSLSRPRVDSFSPQCRLCAYTLEPWHHRSCSVASGQRCHLRSALLLAAPPICRCQPLDDEVLEQPASLAELPVPKVCRVGSDVGRLRAALRAAPGQAAPHRHWATQATRVSARG